VAESGWDSIEKREALEYSAETDTYRASFDSNNESVCAAVISAVAVVSETKPRELPPLYSVCDPDALAALVTPTVVGPSNGDIQVSFTFAGHEVTIHGYGIIAVQSPREDSTD
jgi:hypothetical protein